MTLKGTVLFISLSAILFCGCPGLTNSGVRKAVLAGEVTLVEYTHGATHVRLKDGRRLRWWFPERGAMRKWMKTCGRGCKKIQFLVE